MGGRGSGSGVSSWGALGLQVENEIDESRFNFFNIRYGSYARQLARESNESKDEDEVIVSYTKGKNIAYAHVDPESDTLIAIMSTGGGAGTDLLSKVMQHQQKQGKGLNWLADNPESIKYYDKLGLGKYGKGNSKSKFYELGPSDVSQALKKLNR